MTNEEIWLYRKAGSGGGGTTVVPNPEGTATGNLNKIQIDEDIFAIPQPDLTNYLTTSDVGAAAISNDYSDLDNLPTIPDAVLANPQDEATADLEKVKIGAVTYGIPASGGGYTLVSNQAVDTGVKWIDGTSPIYAVYLPNGISGSGFTWSTTVGLIVRGITFTYNSKGMSEYDTLDITGELGTQNNFDGTFRAINVDSYRTTATLLYVV